MFIKKVLIVSCVYSPEPVVSAIIGEDLAEALAKKNIDVTVITPMPTRPFGFKFEGDKVKSKTANPNVIQLNSFTFPQSGILGRLRESISFGVACYKFIKKSSEFDCVYMNTWPLFGQLGVAIACNIKNTPYIVHVQDVYPESLTNKLPLGFRQVANVLLFPIEKYILRNAATAVAISHKMKSYLAQTRSLSENKIDVVINWQNQNAFIELQNSWPDEAQKLTFMYLGNIGPVAGVEFLIETFVNSKVDARLIIAGSGTRRKHCEKIAEIHIETDIKFMDVPAGKVAEVQSMAHVLLLPTIKGTSNNSIPSKLPAYMFSARPVVTLTESSSDIAKAIRESNCGWVGDSEDEQWMMNRFTEISISKQFDLRMKGQNALSYANECFSREINLDKLTNAITKNHNDRKKIGTLSR
jgi:glycosyltransferase involved in cell wall biosynthesis